MDNTVVEIYVRHPLKATEFFAAESSKEGKKEKRLVF